MRLTRRTEYGLMALAWLARAGGRFHSVREITENLDVPRRLLAEILKDLSQAGLVEAVRGPGGGYRLREDPGRLTLGRIVNVLEGPTIFAECYQGDCDLSPRCTIKRGIGEVARRLEAVLEDFTLEEVVHGPAGAPAPSPSS